MHYWSDENSGVCVCKMGERFDEKEKSNVEHALDYICGRLGRAMKSGVPSQNQFYRPDYNLRDLFEPYIAKYIKDEYKGVARCSSTDTFQYNVGQTLARARCLEAFYSDLMAAIAAIGGLLEMLDNVNYGAFINAENSASYWEEQIDSAQ